MENATKALLIAAAVLIVILLIAFGMRIMNSATDSSEQAKQVGTELTTQTGIAGESAVEAIQGIKAPAQE